MFPYLQTLRILNITAKSEKRETKQSIKVSAARFGHGVFVQWDGKQSSTDMNNTLTYGYEGDKKEILESFKVFQNQPSVMGKKIFCEIFLINLFVSFQ